MTLSSKFNLKAALLVNTLGCGLELIACAGFTYIPPLLRKSGHSETTMALTLGIGPLLGFIFVPYIGEASDNLKSRYGRRRPFILAFSIVAGLSFIVMPYMKTFLPKTPPRDPGDVSDLFDINAAVPTTTLAIIATCLVILFDFSSQVALSPFEALLADLGKPMGSSGSEALYQVYSFMVGFGGIIGYLITSLDWKNNAGFLSLFGAHSQEERVFFVVFWLFVLALFFSLRYSKESAHVGRKVRLDSKSDVPGLPLNPQWCPLVLNKLFYLVCPTSFQRVIHLPKCLQRLCVFQFFAWTSLMGYSLFFTDFVGEGVFDGDPSVEAGLEKNDLYDEGVNIGSYGLLIHCVSCSAFPILCRTFLKNFSTRSILFLAVLSSTLSIFIMVLVPTPPCMVLMSIFPGFLMGALMAIPFQLLTNYHDREEVYLADSPHARGVGTDVAILDSMYFLAEFSLSVFDSVFVFVVGSSYAYMYATIAFGCVALVLVFVVVFDESSYVLHINTSGTSTLGSSGGNSSSGTLSVSTKNNGNPLLSSDEDQQLD